ncbi:MAG: NCS2 family permease [Candidatus Latescibacterota bacterium]|nr:MAG: NCS2 family permease [Candidatus Latescibacterota bacterium]RKY73398.1 MAG: NCS2 family permease [Candidatus Latescibacterota bacterium]
MFNLRGHNTDVGKEVLAGLTTFLTMSYIIVVNPAILGAAGIPKGPSMVATILSAVFGTLLMGFYANRPFAIAPYMGENAFIAYTVVKVLGYSWQTGLGAVFIGGVLFTILTLLKVRKWFVEAIPQSLKYSFAVGIGLFLTFIGLNEAGIVALGAPGVPVKVGQLNSLETLLAILGFIVIAALLIRKVRASILIGILFITLLSYIFQVTKPPESWISTPPSLAPIFLKLDVLGALKWGFFSVILTVFVMDFVDTMGTLIGVSARAGMLDEKGNLPEVEKPMLADALATVAAALLGTTTTGTYIESAAGIEAGGRTGLTAVVTAGLFLLALFFAPFLTAVPAHAYGPALVIVGAMMLEPIRRIDFSDYTELIPSFAVITLMSFTYNLGIGMTAGFVIYPLLKLISGRAREVSAGTWVLGALSLIFYVFYPYGK